MKRIVSCFVALAFVFMVVGCSIPRIPDKQVRYFEKNSIMNSKNAQISIFIIISSILILTMIARHFKILLKIKAMTTKNRNEIASVGSKLFLNYDVGDMVVIGGYPMRVFGNLFGRDLNLNYGSNPISTLFASYVISTLDDFGFVNSRDYMKGEDNGGIPTSLWVTSNIYSAGMFSLFDVAMLNASVVDISMFNYSSKLFSTDITAKHSITTDTLVVNNIVPTVQEQPMNLGGNVYVGKDLLVEGNVSINGTLYKVKVDDIKLERHVKKYIKLMRKEKL